MQEPGIKFATPTFENPIRKRPNLSIVEPPQMDDNDDKIHQFFTNDKTVQPTSNLFVTREPEKKITNQSLMHPMSLSGLDNQRSDIYCPNGKSLGKLPTAEPVEVHNVLDHMSHYITIVRSKCFDLTATNQQLVSELHYFQGWTDTFLFLSFLVS